jgi:hypothetical protein
MSNQPTNCNEQELDRESGAITVELLSWATMSVIAIVAIGAGLQALGVDVIDYIRSQLGV